MKVTEIQVTYKNKVTNAPQITGAEAAANIARANWDDGIELYESFYVILLNRANKVKGIYQVSKGGYSATIVDPKMVFSVALKGAANSIILAHNHPSGSLSPSKADMDITNKLKKAGELLDCPVLDHIILAPGSGYYSFADNRAI